MGYPLRMPTALLLRHPQVEEATRCLTPRQQDETRQVLVSVRGPLPPHIDLGNWGTYYLRPYTREPLRCFRCQRYGHHKDNCSRAVTCGICSGGHWTEKCLTLYKEKKEVRHRCANCGAAHHTWNPACPVRLQRVHQDRERQVTWVQEQQKTSTAPASPTAAHSTTHASPTAKIRTQRHPAGLSPTPRYTCTSTTPGHSTTCSLMLAFNQECASSVERGSPVTTHNSDPASTYHTSEPPTRCLHHDSRSSAHHGEGPHNHVGHSLPAGQRGQNGHGGIPGSGGQNGRGDSGQGHRENAGTPAPATGQLTTPSNYPAASRGATGDSYSYSRPPSSPVQTSHAASSADLTNTTGEHRSRPLRICQWNCRGFRTNFASIWEADIRDKIDLFLLQEKFLPIDTTATLPGFTAFHLPRNEGQRGGLAILARRWIDCREEPHPLSCGDGVEVQAVTVRLPNRQLYLYNVYRPIAAELDIDDVFGLAATEMVLVAGDFNAYHPWLGSFGPTNAAGHSLHASFEDSGQMVLFNDTSCPTHLQAGRLDLTFCSALLNPTPTWSLHPHLTSDHFAIIIGNGGRPTCPHYHHVCQDLTCAAQTRGYLPPPPTPSWRTLISSSRWMITRRFFLPSFLRQLDRQSQQPKGVHALTRTRGYTGHASKNSIGGSTRQGRSTGAAKHLHAGPTFAALLVTPKPPRRDSGRRNGSPGAVQSATRHPSASCGAGSEAFTTLARHAPLHIVLLWRRQNDWLLILLTAPLLHN